MVLEVLVTTFREEKEIVQLEKKEVKLLLFVDVMILSTENPKVTTNKLLEVMNEVSKAIGHKINTETYCISMHF